MDGFSGEYRSHPARLGIVVWAYRHWQYFYLILDQALEDALACCGDGLNGNGYFRTPDAENSLGTQLLPSASSKTPLPDGEV